MAIKDSPQAQICGNKRIWATSSLGTNWLPRAGISEQHQLTPSQRLCCTYKLSLSLRACLFARQSSAGHYGDSTLYYCAFSYHLKDFLKYLLQFKKKFARQQLRGSSELLHAVVLQVNKGKGIRFA